jgi:predicted exporter
MPPSHDTRLTTPAHSVPPRGLHRAPPRGLVWTLFALSLLLGAWAISRANFTADLSAFLPASPDADQRLLVDQLQRGVASRTLMVGIAGGDKSAARTHASKQLAQALRAQAAFTSVNNGERGDYAAAGELLMTHRYVLSPSVTPELFTDAGLRSALQDTALRLATPEGAALKPLWPRDPTGETLRVAESLLPAQSPRMDQGVWVSRDGQRALLLLTLQAGADDVDGQAKAAAAVRDAFGTVISSPAATTPEKLTLQISGQSTFAEQSRTLIEAEATHLSILGAAGVALILWLAFGRVLAVGLAALPVLSGVVMGVAAVALVFGTVHGMTLGFGATLIGESVDYAIYYLIQARPDPRTGKAPWWQDGWPTVRLGLWTSVFGFAALVFSGFPGLAQLGVFSVAGLVTAALVTRYVLPIVAPLGTPGRGARDGLARWTARLVTWLPRLRWPFAALSVVALLFLLLAPQALWRGDLQSLSPVPRAAMQLDAALREDLGASDARTLVVAHGATMDAALQAAHLASERLQALVDSEVLLGFDNPARLLPPLAVQAARRAALPEAKDLTRLVTEATQGLPFRAAQIAPFTDDVQAARMREPLTPAQLRGTALGTALDALVFQRSDGRWAALMPLQWAPTASTPDADAATLKLRQTLAPLPDVTVLDVKASLDGLYGRYMREALWQAVLGALAVVLLLAWVLKSAKRLLAVVLPLVMAVVLTLGLLAALQVPLGILHLVGTLLVVAAGSNYALFFNQLATTSAPIGDSAQADTWASLLLANLTTVLTFGLMATSNIAVLAAMGMVVAPGALLSWVLSASLMGKSSPVP